LLVFSQSIHSNWFHWR